MGEGGGQILRTALSLSAVTGHPFRISRIRHGRMKPGLRPQHLAAARATAAICGGTLAGDSVGSAELSLEPRAVVPQAVLAVRHRDGRLGPAPLPDPLLAARPGRDPDPGLPPRWHPPGPQPVLPLPGAGLGAGGRPAGVPVRPHAPAGRVLPGRGWGVRRLRAASPGHAPPRPPAPGHAPRGGRGLARVGGGFLGGRAAGRPRGAPDARGGGLLPATGRPHAGGPSRGSHLLVVARFERVRSGHSATSEGGGSPIGPPTPRWRDFPGSSTGTARWTATSPISSSVPPRSSRRGGCPARPPWTSPPHSL